MKAIDSLAARDRAEQPSTTRPRLGGRVLTQTLANTQRSRSRRVRQRLRRTSFR